MEDVKTASALSRVWKAAYTQPPAKQRNRRKQPVPGKLFDVAIVGLFVVLGIAHLV